MRNAPNTVNLQKLRSACLPDMVLKATLPSLKQDHLRAVIAGREYRTTDGQVSYLFTGDTPFNVARAAAVFGKELVLSGEKVAYVPCASLLRLVYGQDTLMEDETLSVMLAEHPFLIVPDIHEENWAPNAAARALVHSLIQQHFYRGGGVVLAGRSGASGDVAFDLFTTGFTEVAIHE